jgi:hypothetical protein
MRAIFTSFDHFMVIFVAAFGVVWSTLFMPLLGGPLHTYETRAIGAGWRSLQSGQAASIGEALDIASSLPVEAVFPSASAAELAPREATLTAQLAEPVLLGGLDDANAPALRLVAATPERHRARRIAPPSAPEINLIEASAAPACDVAAAKQGFCDVVQAAST